MLAEYLAKPAPISEKLSIPQSSEQNGQVVADKVQTTKDLLEDWQSSWEKNE